MKKVCAWILMAVLVFSLAGCGGTRNNDMSGLPEEISNSEPGQVMNNMYM